MDGADGAPQLKRLIIMGGSSQERSVWRQHLADESQYSYLTTDVATVSDALDLQREEAADLVICDLTGAEHAYEEFLGELKQLHLVAPPTIILASDGDEDLAVKMMKQGAYDYLPKGHLTAQVLQVAVRGALERSQLQKQLETSRDRQRLIATTALRIRHSLNLDRILETAVAQVRRLLSCDRALVYRLEPSSQLEGVAVAESVSNGWQSMLGDRHLLPHIEGERVNWQKWQQVQGDIETASLTEAERELLQGLRVKARMAIPISIGATQDTTGHSLWGLLVVHQCSAVRQWLDEEVDALRELAVQLAIAIQQSQLLAQTQASLKKEKDLNSLKSKIISTISHEYRTPLTAILTAAATLGEHAGKLSKDMQRRCLNIVEQRARHLSYLVDDMVFASELEMVRESYQPCLLDAERFFDEIVEMRKVGASMSHTWEVKVSGEAEGFWGDRNILRQVFGNLLSNAIKYSPDGGLISIEVTGTSDAVQVVVADEGIGIPAEELDGLFQEFNRGSNVGTISGTGLGLAIAKSCVELHQGEIAIKSNGTKGTQVIVTLPKRESGYGTIESVA